MKYFNLIVTMFLCISASYAQQSVSGTVVDEEGMPLVGATVTVKDSDPLIGARTDLDGKYSIEVPEQYTMLTFSYTGFTTTDIEITGSTIDVTMSSGVNIDDLVVTALGISRDEKALGYSVSDVDGDEVTGSGETNAVQGLSAKVAGVQVIGSGGVPGASSKVIIRGNATFTGQNQPLFVVDGVPYNNRTEASAGRDLAYSPNLGGVNNGNRLLDLNPADIAKVTVLKGPAAAALYGTRAANGAIIITTKRGGTSGKKGLDVSFSSSVGIDQVNKLPELQDKYAQGVYALGPGNVINPVERDANGNITSYNEGGFHVPGGGNNAGTPNSWGPRIGGPADTFGLKAFDNYDAFFRTGVTYNNNLSVSGGSGMTSFRLSYGNTTSKGIVPNTDLVRNSLRLNARIGTDVFSVTGTAAYSNTTGTRAQNGSNISGIMLGLSRMPASFDILGGDGPNGYDTKSGLGHNYFFAYDNPLWSAHNNPQNNNVNRFTGSFLASYNPMDWLSFNYRMSADAYTDYRKQIIAVGGNTTEPRGVGRIDENTQRHLEINTDIYATATRNLTSDIQGTFTLGTNLNHRFFGDLYARGRNLTVPGFYNLANASDLYASELNETKRLAGIFFDAGFSYKSLVFLNIAGRNDWASTFGEEKRKSGFFYPSVSGSFVFTELMDDNDILSFGKVRASVAQSGVEPDVYSTNTYLTAPFLVDGFTSGLSFPYLGQAGLGVSSILGDNTLQPEVLTGIEFGVDLRFLQGRINLDLTYYNQKSTNLLVQRPISAASGHEFAVSNAGSMVNRGWEILLGATIFDKKFKWDASVNFTANRNEVLELSEGVDEINIEAAFASIGSYAIAGQPYGALYATTWERTEDGQLIIGPDGLPIIGDRDRVGDPFPDWLMGIRNTFSYQGFTLSALIDIRQGGDIWGGTIARLQQYGATKESAEGRDGSVKYVIDGVKQAVDDQGAAVTDANGKPVATGDANTREISAYDYFFSYKSDRGATEEAIFDGSWIRLRELTLTYTIPTSKIKFLQGAQVYVTGRNLFLITDYPGVDPETSLTGAGSNVSGFDYFNMPNTRSFIFGLRANF